MEKSRQPMSGLGRVAIRNAELFSSSLLKKYLFWCKIYIEAVGSRAQALQKNSRNSPRGLKPTATDIEPLRGSS